MSRRGLLIGVVGVGLAGGVALAVTPFGRDLLFHVVPIRWTDESIRLAFELGLREGSVVADVGAGDGSLIVELARIVGPTGRAIATERSDQQRRRIAKRTASARLWNVSVVEALERTTNLPDECCDAITMRMVLHHIADARSFALDLKRALRPGGRVGIVEFGPGALPHLAGDHGVSAEKVVAAFTSAGFKLTTRDDTWGGRTYLLVFSTP